MYFVELEPRCPNQGARVEGHFHSILGVLSLNSFLPITRAPKATVHLWDKAGKVLREVLAS